MKKIMLHIIMENQLGGPNICMYRINDSILKNKFSMSYLKQNFLAGGKISIRLIKDLKQQIKKVEPDIVHVSGLQSSGFHAVVAARLSGVPNIVLNIHGSSTQAIHINPIKKFVFGKIIEPLTIKLSTYVIFNSEHTKNLNVCSNFNKSKRSLKSKVIYNLNSERYSGTSSLRQELGIDNDAIVITIASRIVYDKGYDNVANLINSLSHNKSVCFVIIGEGDYRETFESKIVDDSNTFMIGQTDKVQEYFSISDIFILPSFHETLSNVTLEAMKQGLPCIVSDVGGLREIVIENYNGYLINPIDFNELVSKTTALVESKELREAMSKNAVTTVSNKFSNNKILEEFENVYNSTT